MPARPLEPEPPQMPERPTERKLPGPDCFAVQGGLSVALQLASQPRASRLVYDSPKLGNHVGPIP
ncbi:hypothetical protein NW824_06015, partial [Synechococcus sp. R60.3]